MAKLHELLAVDTSLKSQVDKARGDLLNTFEKKRHHFSKKLITFKPLAEDAAPITEEQLDLQTTVARELAWIRGLWAPAIDTSAQIAEANTTARADVVLNNGRVLLKDVPATSLLELEKRVSEVHTLVSQVPTLDPAKGFTPDPSEGPGIFKAREETKTRTQKQPKPIVLYEATKEHAAQVQLLSLDVPTGTIHQQEWSGLITTAEKADMLERVEELRRAIKAARARANEVIVPKISIGDTLLSYVFGA